jgi:alkylhydroperoxidase/carboxymuconolactone decarboxylase family protein YurZ
VNDAQDWTFRYEPALNAALPAVRDAQSAWLAAIDSITHLDRATHELIRMVCTAILRQPEGVERHARLAAESGASWEQIVSALVLTEPAFGVLPAAEALPPARAGYDAAAPAERNGED